MIILCNLSLVLSEKCIKFSSAGGGDVKKLYFFNSIDVVYDNRQQQRRLGYLWSIANLHYI